MSRSEAAKLRAVPSAIPPDDQRVVSRIALANADRKLKQIKAIADLLSVAEEEYLFDDTIGFAASAICDLAEEATAGTE